MIRTWIESTPSLVLIFECMFFKISLQVFVFLCSGLRGFATLDLEFQFLCYSNKYGKWTNLYLYRLFLNPFFTPQLLCCFHNLLLLLQLNSMALMKKGVSHKNLDTNNKKIKKKSISLEPVVIPTNHALLQHGIPTNYRPVSQNDEINANRPFKFEFKLNLKTVCTPTNPLFKKWYVRGVRSCWQQKMDRVFQFLKNLRMGCIQTSGFVSVQWVFYFN